jgi:hypothetical protein
MGLAATSQKFISLRMHQHRNFRIGNVGETQRPLFCELFYLS